VQTLVKFTRINEIEAMYGRSRVNVKVEPRSTLTFAPDLPYIVSILFTYARKNYATVEINLKAHYCSQGVTLKKFLDEAIRIL